MNKQDVSQALEIIKKDSPQRKFSQSVDLIINLKDFNIKQTDNQVDIFVNLGHDTGKKITTCGLVGPELADAAKASCDHVVVADDFDKIAADKKAVKKLATSYDFFIAQANIMANVAKAFGRVFGPKGKMPNPKAGCVVPPNANVAALVEKLQRTAHVKAKTEYAIKVRVGTQAMDEHHIIDNIMSVYNAVIHALPNDKNNVKNVMLKLTMGKPTVIGSKGGDESESSSDNEKEASSSSKEQSSSKNSSKTQPKDEAASGEVISP